MVSTQKVTSPNVPTRRSITFILPDKTHDDSDKENSPQHTATSTETENSGLQVYRNIDRNVYCKNQSECLLCGKKIHSQKEFLARHYEHCHPDHEVFNARPSPEMADKLRLQTEKFIVNDQGKMVGKCCFCEVIKIFRKQGWRDHILGHTGEKVFSCSQCSSEVNYRNQHDSKIIRSKSKCTGTLYELCAANSSDGSYFGFMCNDCNFVQMKLERMIKHLTNEHGIDSPTETQHYQKVKLLPSMEILSL